jgi:hypothetical protein
VVSGRRPLTRDHDASLDQAIAEVVTRPFSSRRQKAGSQKKNKVGELVSTNPHMLYTDKDARLLDRPPSFPPPGKGPQRTDRSQQLYG